MPKSVRYYIQPIDDDQALVRGVPVALPPTLERSRPETGRTASSAAPAAAPGASRQPTGRSRVARLVRAAIRRGDEGR